MQECVMSILRVLQLEVRTVAKLFSGPVFQPRGVHQELCVLGHAVPQDDILNNSGNNTQLQIQCIAFVRSTDDFKSFFGRKEWTC